MTTRFPILKDLMEYHLQAKTGFTVLPDEGENLARNRFRTHLARKYGCSDSQINKIISGSSGLTVQSMLAALGYLEKTMDIRLRQQAQWELTAAIDEKPCPEKYDALLDKARANLAGRFAGQLAAHLPVASAAGAVADEPAPPVQPASRPDWLLTPGLQAHHKRSVEYLASDKAFEFKCCLVDQVGADMSVARGLSRREADAQSSTLINRLRGLCEGGDSEAALAAVNDAVKQLAADTPLLPTEDVLHISRAAMQLFVLLLTDAQRFQRIDDASANARPDLVYVRTGNKATAAVLAEGSHLRGELHLSHRQDATADDPVAIRNYHEGGGLRPGFQLQANMAAIEAQLRTILPVLGQFGENVKPMAATLSATRLRQYLRDTERYHRVAIRFLADTRGAFGAQTLDLGRSLQQEIGIAVVAFGDANEPPATHAGRVVVVDGGSGSLDIKLVMLLQSLHDFESRQAPARSA